MFIYCFDAFLDNKPLYLLSQMIYFRLSIVFHGGESITYIAWAKFSKVMLWTQPKAILHSETAFVLSIKYLELAFSFWYTVYTSIHFTSISVNIFGKVLYAERGIVHLTSSPGTD